MSTEPETWQTDAPGPFMTLRAGGPLEGVVTLTAVAEGHGRTLVEARWQEGGHTRSASVEAESYERARELAQLAAAELAAGVAPELAPA